MNFTQNVTDVGRIFTNNYFYEIPPFQRKFVWTSDEWDDLWSDLLFSMKETGKIKYFLGSLIFQKAEELQKWIVVDGQQRLTSLLMIFSLICKKFVILNDTYYNSSTRKLCLLGNNSTKKEESRVINPDIKLLNLIVDFCTENRCLEIDNYLKSITYNVKKSEIQLLNCFKFYSEQLDQYLLDSDNTEIEKLSSLRDSIMGITVIELTVNDDKSASLVFETINGRGQELEPHELIKNYLYMYENPIKGAELVKDKWNEILRNFEKLENNILSNFIAHYTIFEFEKVHKTEIFKTFKKNTPRDDINKRISHLLEASIIYKGIIIENDNNYSKLINYYLHCFSIMKITSIRPTLLSLFFCFKRGTINEKKLINTLRIIKNFFSVNVAIGGKKTNELQDLFFDYSLRINKEKEQKEVFITIDNFLAELVNKKLDYTTFSNNFINLGYTKYPEKYKNMNLLLSKQKCQYILKEFEIFLQDNDDNIVSSFSIEHIKDDELSGNACFIGNLTPLPIRKNGKLIGKNMETKKIAYASSDYSSTRKLADKSNILLWNDESIKNRSEHMAKTFYNDIWKTD